MHRKHQRHRLIRIFLHLLRHIHVPLAHPAADFFIVVFHSQIGNRITCHTQVAARAALPAALPVQEILPDPAQQRVGIVGRRPLDRAGADAERLFFLIGCIRRLLCADVFGHIRRSQVAGLCDPACCTPIGCRAVICAKRAVRIVDHPCRHRDFALFNAFPMGLVNKAVQVGAEIICRSLAVLLRHRRTAYCGHAGPYRWITHHGHVRQHATLPAAGQVELGLMHTELKPFLACQTNRMDVSHIAVCLAVRLVRVPLSVLRLKEKHDQFFLGFLCVRDHPPPAVAPQVVRCLPVLRQDKYACRRGTRPLRDIDQIPALLAADRYGLLKCPLIQRF